MSDFLKYGVALPLLFFICFTPSLLKAAVLVFGFIMAFGVCAGIYFWVMESEPDDRPNV